jgi:uncharacterized protein YaaN involved in tellurite resistance
MRKKAKSENPRELLSQVFESAFDTLDELSARLKDLDQKVEHIIKNLPKDRNGLNHH